MMRHITFVILALSVIAQKFAYGESTEDFKPLGEISARALKAIEVAKPEFLKWGGSATKDYTVSVHETARTLVVDFCLSKSVVSIMDGDKKITEWHRCRGFAVELDKATFKVIEAVGHRD